MVLQRTLGKDNLSVLKSRIAVIMSSIPKVILVALAALPMAPLLAQTSDHAPVALPSADAMTQDKAGSESWTYINPAAKFTKYKGVTVEPTRVYNGPDAQFADIDKSDRARFAEIMTGALQTELAGPYPAIAGSDNLRVQVTLLGAQKTKGGIATATRVTSIGFATSALKSVLGKQGTFTGSLLFAVEVFDARTGELLLAAVRRRTPDPLDIPATLSTIDTMKAVSRDFANAAHKRLDNMTQTGKP